MVVTAYPGYIGVNGESGGTSLTRWRSEATVGALLADMVRFVDQEGDGTGISIIINEGFALEDRNDSLGPTYQESLGDYVGSQRGLVAGRLSQALTSITFPEGITTDAQKIAYINDRLDLLETALYNNSGSTYNLEAVRAYLRRPEGGISLAQIAGLQGETSDARIANLLRSMGEDPEQFTTAHMQAFEQLETLASTQHRADVLHSLDGKDLSSEASVRTALQELGYSQAIIDAVITHLNEGEVSYSDLIEADLASTIVYEEIEANAAFQAHHDTGAAAPALTEENQDIIDLANGQLEEHRLAEEPSDSVMPSGPQNIQEILASRGVAFETLDINGDGTITRTEVQYYNAHNAADAMDITENIFNLIANNMVVGSGDGEISQAEWTRAVDVISRYTMVRGISDEEAVELYFNPDATFRNEDLDAMEAASTAVFDELNNKDLSDAAHVRTALQELGYSSAVIEAVIAEISDYSIGAAGIASIIINVVEDARTGRGPNNLTWPPGQYYTPEMIMGFLRGEGVMDPSIFFTDESMQETMNNIQWSQSLQERQGHARTLLQSLISAGRLAEAECLLRILTDETYMGGQYSQYHVDGIAGDDEVARQMAAQYVHSHQYTRALHWAETVADSDVLNNIYRQIANGYLDQRPPNYTGALDAAQHITDMNQRDQILQPLFQTCRTGTDPGRLQLAYEIGQFWLEHGSSSGSALDNLALVAQACVTSTNPQVRALAETIVNYMAEHSNPDTDTVTIRRNTPSGPQETEMSVAAFRQQTIDSLRTPPEIAAIRASVLPAGAANPNLANAPHAIEQLQALIAAHSADTPEDREIKAHAYLALADIYRAAGDSVFDEGYSGHFHDTDAYHMYELAARCGHQAATLFIGLRDAAPAGSEDRTYYNSMVGKSNGVIGQLIVDFTPYFADTEHKGSDGLRLADAGAFTADLRTLAKYIPTGSPVSYTDENRQPRDCEASVLFKRRVALNDDQAHPASYFTAHPAPADPLDAYQQIMPPPPEPGGLVVDAEASTTGRVNQQFSYTFTVNEPVGDVAWTLGEGDQAELESFGLTFANGVISGRPNHAGTITLSVTSTDSADPPHTNTREVTFTIQPPIPAGTITGSGNLGNATVGTAFTGRTLTVHARPSGTALAFAFVGNHPTWLSITPGTGVVSGTPPAGTTAGDVTFQVRAYEGAPAKTFTVHVGAAATPHADDTHSADDASGETASLAIARTGTNALSTTSDANIVLTITGGTGPYTISGLPAGLTPTVTGQRIVITGRATTEGSYSVTVSD
ncbi:MAG: putative Ig domain-containing protein, partial [Candidatus Margulisbacteria bacterium]|nr:putative Ig domain-containing protein [Candidatus Margulisiibacteriota bacterium]